jgi:pimeloyl-ACP methyl ester carboxylesterase
MALPPDTRPMEPLPADLPPLTAWSDVDEAATEAVRRFTTPPPITRRITEAERRPEMPRFMPPGAVHHDVLGSEGRVAYWSWGAPDWPLVACLHGWGGRGTQWSAMVAALLERQHRVVVLDAPAHGASDGDRASMPGFRNALLRVLDAAGPPHALIGHSLGGLAVLAAIASRANAGAESLPRAVSIGAPSSVDRPMARFLRRHAGSADVHASMIAQLERRWHFRWRDMDTAALARQAASAGGAPLLVVHADDDAQVPVIEADGLTADWPGATRWIAPDGCGHVRILLHADVIARITEFVTQR